MPLGDQLYRVVALTLSPTFVDYYHQRGGPYNPSAIGERGFMYETEAVAADGTDVLAVELHTPLEIERALKGSGPLAMLPHIGSMQCIAHILPGAADAAGTVTITYDVGAGDQTINFAVAASDSAEAAAATLAAQTGVGVTLALDGSIETPGAASVVVTSTAGPFTKFEIGSIVPLAVPPTAGKATGTVQVATQGADSGPDSSTA